MTNKYPKQIETKGKRGKTKTPPDGAVEYFTVADEIRRVSSIGPGDKILYLQKIQFDNGSIELRFGYYIIGKKGRVKGRWVWGQYAPFIPVDDFRYMVEDAKELGWI